MIAESVLVLFGIGLGSALLLALASRLLYVYEDPRVARVEQCLAGANCGACGYPGCPGAAQAVVAGKAGANVCVVGGPASAKAVAEIMGLTVEEREPERAWVDCTGGRRAEAVYRYEGVADCRAQHLFHNGAKMCPEGCLGLGSCVAACQFDAIRMGPDNYPVVDPERCVACGGCAQACPRGVISILSMSARLTHLNETSDCLAPCRQKCPGQIDIPRYIQQLRRGDVAGAVLTIKERNPLLLVCGRVCPRPCETACRRNHVDSPVAINMLKRYAADWEMNSGARLHIPCAPDTKRRVAVVGGGPAGLSCAYFLRRLGHSPTIFESMPLLGGQLRYGIPEYRLPKAVLDWEIEGILELGVEVRTGLRFGRDIGLESLRAEGFEAVFLGIGAWLSSAMRVEGEDSEGVMAGTEFLTRVGLGADTGLGKKVVVVGGGNTAIDAARTSVRLGAEATIMYRRSRQEMPANDEEVLGAEQEGVKFMFLAAPTRVLTGPSGRAEALEYVQMKLGEPDASGRRRPEPVPGSETTIQADTIIAAIGQKPELACLYLPDQTCPLEETKWRTLAADPDTLQTSLPDVFTAGDMFTGPNLVIGAVGGGRRAARSIHQFLTQGAVTRPDKLQRDMIPYTLFSNVQDVRPRQRAETPHLCHGRERTCTFAEIEGPLNADQALAESCRCLHCGLTCYDRDPEPGAA